MKAVAPRIYYDSESKRYHPKASLNGKAITFGHFSTQETAQEVLDAFYRKFPDALGKRGRKKTQLSDAELKSLALAKIESLG